MTPVAGLEQAPRGAYTGAIGRIDADGGAAFNVAIRTLAIRGQEATMGLGGGIVADSTADAEWDEALAKGGFVAHAQRPLWASTGVKDPSLPDTLYVTELVAPNTVNTMPEKTLDAVADHSEITGDTITGTCDESNAHLDRLAELGGQVLADRSTSRFVK